MSQGDLWQRFTNPATRVIHFAQEEARGMRQTIVGTEHILLGLLREADGIAAQALRRLGVTLDDVYTALMRHPLTPEDIESSSARLVLSARGKAALVRALEEATEINLRLGLLDFVDTEHLLLGLLDSGETDGNRATCVLSMLHVDPASLRVEVMRLLHDGIANAGMPATVSRHLPTDFWLYLTEDAFRVFMLALDEARRTGTSLMTVPTMALGLLHRAEPALLSRGITLDQARNALADVEPAEPCPTPSLTPRCADVLGFALAAAAQDTPPGAHPRITPRRLARAIVRAGDTLADETASRLQTLGIDLLASLDAELE